MARRLMPRLPARCQHKVVELSLVSIELAGHCHYCHDIFNLIKKSIEINNKLKKWWQSWQSLAQSKSRLMGFTLIKFNAVKRPPKYGAERCINQNNT
jgi:hypothetical protein